MLVEPDSKTWRAVSNWAEAELQKARDALESPGITERDSDTLRGAISTLKALKSLGKVVKNEGV